MTLPFIIIFLCGKVLSENVIEVDDILSADFMPGNLLVLENPQERSVDFKNASFYEIRKANNLDGALSTMGYHRY